MNVITLNVGTTERAIEYAVLVLSKTRYTYKYSDIADFCGCTELTIKRAMPKLIRTGVIIRRGDRAIGYRYELGEHHSYAKL